MTVPIAFRSVKKFSAERDPLDRVVRRAVSRYVRETAFVDTIIDDIKELQVANEYRNRMRIRCSDVYQTSGNLSGGNQQKVVLSKWLFTDPEILILDEPTRGIDIGAKYEIYCIINDLADAGKAVVVISSEMPELLGICDRICVMNEGAFVGEFDRGEATQEKIMRVIVRKGERLVDRDLERKLEEKALGEAHP